MKRAASSNRWAAGLAAALLLGLSACGSTLNSISANPLTIGLSAPSVSLGAGQPFAKVNVDVTYTCQISCPENDKAVLSITPLPPAGMTLDFDNFNTVYFKDSDIGTPAVFNDPLSVIITNQTPAGTYTFTITATHTTLKDPISGNGGGSVETKSVALQVVVTASGTGSTGGMQVSGTIAGVSGGTVQLRDLSESVLASAPYSASGFALALPTPSPTQLTPLVVGNTCTGTQTPGLMHLPTNLVVTQGPGTGFSSIAPTSDPNLLNLFYVDRAGTVDQTCQEGGHTAHYSEVFSGAGWYGFINNAGIYTVKPVASLGHTWQ